MLHIKNENLIKMKESTKNGVSETHFYINTDKLEAVDKKKRHLPLISIKNYKESLENDMTLSCHIKSEENLNKIVLRMTEDKNNFDNQIFLMAIPFKGVIYETEHEYFNIAKLVILNLAKPLIVKCVKYYKVAFIVATLNITSLQKTLDAMTKNIASLTGKSNEDVYRSNIPFEMDLKFIIKYKTSFYDENNNKILNKFTLTEATTVFTGEFYNTLTYDNKRYLKCNTLHNTEKLSYTSCDENDAPETTKLAFNIHNYNKVKS